MEIARSSRVLCIVLCLLASSAPRAGDEGMWTFDNLPRAAIQARYGVRLDDQWVHRLQTAVVRLESGCTGTFVSADGLVLTNHHCVQTCLAEHSTPRRDLVAQGFQPAAREDELRCEGEEVSVLVATENVTNAVSAALAEAAGGDLARRRNETLSALESRCEADAARSGPVLRCEAVTLYKGAEYWLYKYRRYDDVRLAFSPELAVAAFGGDPDNFQFPRWCLDFSLLRVYDNGRPAAPESWLRVNWTGAVAGSPVFVAGHPGTTERLLTADQLRAQRDVYLPFWLVRYSELRGRLLQFSLNSPESARQGKDYLDGIENSHKVRRMQLATLLRTPVIDEQAREDDALRQAVRGTPELAGRVEAAFQELAHADQIYRDLLVPYTWIAAGAGFDSDLFAYARTIVRAVTERQKPNTERLREFTDARLPAIRAALAARTPVYAELERLRLTFGLERMREYLGADHPVVARVLGAEAPADRARGLIAGTRLDDPAVRLDLLDGGLPAVQASRDPMIALARAVEPESRALRARYDAEVTAPVERAQQVLADARFAAYGTTRYPDATFTLRLSYGAIEGWNEEGTHVEPFTHLGRLFERATGSAPFALPPSWRARRSALDPSTPVNFTTTNDIVGGNSGSAVVDARGEIVGLVFDGNIHSIAGTYWYDPETNRTVAVHPAFIRTALTQVYRADRLAAELGMR